MPSCAKGQAAHFVEWLETHVLEVGTWMVAWHLGRKWRRASEELGRRAERGYKWSGTVKDDLALFRLLRLF